MLPHTREDLREGPVTFPPINTSLRVHHVWKSDRRELVIAPNPLADPTDATAPHRLTKLANISHAGYNCGDEVLQ
jgi:hypothetical protein